MKKNLLPALRIFILLTILSSATDGISQSRLYNAVVANNASRAKKALERGENPNGDGNPQQIPIIAATELNYYHMVVLLANHNANINIQNHIGFTALMEAAIQRNNRIMQFLIGKGARLETKANNGASALMVAVAAGNNRGARLLLEAGANPNVTDNNGITPLMRALESGDNPEMIKLLADFKTDLNARTPAGKPAIMVYSYRNRIPAHKELIRLGADINIRDNEGKTPLIKAVLEGNLEMVKLLVESGANREIADNTGTTALDYGAALLEIRQYFDSLR
jgi:ankyrin repeat protein